MEQQQEGVKAEDGVKRGIWSQKALADLEKLYQGWCNLATQARKELETALAAGIISEQLALEIGVLIDESLKADLRSTGFLPVSDVSEIVGADVRMLLAKIVDLNDKVMFLMDVTMVTRQDLTIGQSGQLNRRSVPMSALQAYMAERKRANEERAAQRKLAEEQAKATQKPKGEAAP